MKELTKNEAKTVEGGLRFCFFYWKGWGFFCK
ncbi:hypothetical protein ABID30_002127 [Enterococcus rotai]|uniref:Bacteriocin n=2 Tax=Enterococcus TaxID=1350 RepID=A0ABZ2TCN9_9ENTE